MSRSIDLERWEERMRLTVRNIIRSKLLHVISSDTWINVTSGFEVVRHFLETKLSVTLFLHFISTSFYYIVSRNILYFCFFIYIYISYNINYVFVIQRTNVFCLSWVYKMLWNWFDINNRITWVNYKKNFFHIFLIFIKFDI